MKSTSTKHKISGKTELSVIMESGPSHGAADPLNYIATAAYYKAEARSFVPGHELDDWLEAVAEYDEREGH